MILTYLIIILTQATIQSMKIVLGDIIKLVYQEEAAQPFTLTSSSLSPLMISKGLSISTVPHS